MFKDKLWEWFKSDQIKETQPTIRPSEVFVLMNFVDWLDTERSLTLRAPDSEHSGASTVEYGATSNCIECGKRIVFCGDDVWLHCESQLHGHARPNGAIANPPRS